MGFKAKNVEIGNIPEWMVEQASPSISWERHKELLSENQQSLKEEIQKLQSKVNKLNADKLILNQRINEHKLKLKDSLTDQELMFLLHFIKEANFKGGQLEHVFQVTLKLQNQYRFLEKKEKKKS
jgi:hypothetical protein